MKTLLVLGLSLISFNLAVAATSTSDAKPIEMKVEKLADGTHWMPKEVTVTEGEKVDFVATNKLEGQKFHGFVIKGLVDDGSVNFGETKHFPVTITLKPGTYDIGCQFHPTHKTAKLIVKPAPAKATDKKG